jgi:Domain of unknown function (DUF4371)
MKVIEENRQRLRPIIEIIIFLGRQNIALRDHRDDGRIQQKKTSLRNEGNFREALKYKAIGDGVLENYLKTTASNATHISKTTKNQLIEVISDGHFRMTLFTSKKSKKIARLVGLKGLNPLPILVTA